MGYDVLKNVVGSSLLYGNTVYFTESGESVPYILVQPGNTNNFLFLRKYAPADKVEFFAEAADLGTTDSERIYEGHTLDKFMTETFYGRFTAEWQRIFVENSIAVTRASDGLTYSIKRKVFAPSATELGVAEQSNGTVPTESPFGAYKNFQTNAQNKRKCQLGSSNGDNVEYWTRSKNNHVGNTFNYYALTIDENGDYDTGSWQRNKFYTRPVISINENVTIINEGSSWRVIPNLPPEKPTVSTRKFTVRNGEPFDLNWNAVVDSDGPTVPKYRVQAMIDSGSWYTVLESTDTSFSKTFAYREVESEINYRVQSFDDYNNASDWISLAVVTVSNNLPPSGPSYITVNGKYKGESISVTWGAATDEDGNLQGYKVYRSVNNGAYALVNTTASTVFRETAGDWNTVKYKVHAYDESGEESTDYKESSVSLSTRVTMSVVISEDSDITNGSTVSFLPSSKERDMEIKFVLSDTVSGGEYNAFLFDGDGSILVLPNISTGNHSFVIEQAYWRTILNGAHSFSIVVENEEGYTVSADLNFEKNTTGVYLTLAEPVVVDSENIVDKFSLNIVGSLPEGITYNIMVTNNANDIDPIWQQVSSTQINTGEFVLFDNTYNENGNAFNFIIEVSRGTATEECYISSINGIFGRDIFEYIFARIEALEAGAANV